MQQFQGAQQLTKQILLLNRYASEATLERFQTPEKRNRSVRRRRRAWRLRHTLSCRCGLPVYGVRAGELNSARGSAFDARTKSLNHSPSELHCDGVGAGTVCKQV